MLLFILHYNGSKKKYEEWAKKTMRKFGENFKSSFKQAPPIYTVSAMNTELPLGPDGTGIKLEAIWCGDDEKMRQYLDHYKMLDEDFLQTLLEEQDEN